MEAQPLADSERVWKLRAHFLPSPPPEFSPGDFRVVDPDGQVDREVRVTHVVAVQEDPGALDVFVRVSDPERAKRLRSDSARYALKIDAPGLDRFFQDAPFRFDGGPAGPAGGPDSAPGTPAGPDIDYLAKDYASFRKVMLDRMATSVPEWRERNPADIGVAIVETLAYAADYLSYFQDAVATEAYLDTARRRSSVRKHLRLIGYRLHEGCNARVWVQIQVKGSVPLDLPSGMALLTQAGDLPAVLLEGSPQHSAALEQGSLVFETMHPVRLRPSLNRMALHCWGSADYVLPRGSTTAALAGDYSRELNAGDVLIFEYEGPEAGEKSGQRLRHAVRLREAPRAGADPLNPMRITEVEFHDEDALPADLPVRRNGAGGLDGECLVARGNVVLADHGQTAREHLPNVREGEPYRPVLSSTAITRREPFDPAIARRGAASAMSQSAERSVPAVTLFEVVGERDEMVGEPWQARLDLLESQPFSAHFVAETESDGSVRLRFGDGRQGRKPAPGTRFVAEYRTGNGPLGHVGPESVTHITQRADQTGGQAPGGESVLAGTPIVDATPTVQTSGGSLDGGQTLYYSLTGVDATGEEGRPSFNVRAVIPDGPATNQVVLEGLIFTAGTASFNVYRGSLPSPLHRIANAQPLATSFTDNGLAGVQDLPVLQVRNPLPAEGGEAPEPLERARLVAPRTFRENRNCVTPADLVRLAESHRDVLHAAAESRWTGSWETLFLFVQRYGGAALTPAFERRLGEFLKPRLLAGMDLEIRSPEPLPLEIKLRGVIEPRADAAAVRAKVLERLGSGASADGHRGYFHPDHFSFGQPAHLDGVLDEAMKVTGVVSMRAEVFRKFGSPRGAETVEASIEPGTFEIVRVDNRIGEPWFGVLEVELEVGS